MSRRGEGARKVLGGKLAGRTIDFFERRAGESSWVTLLGQGEGARRRERFDWLELDWTLNLNLPSFRLSSPVCHARLLSRWTIHLLGWDRHVS
jgi:hypothetical protein